MTLVPLRSERAASAFLEAPMTSDIYRRLAAHLDTLPAGFPPTQSGVELRILRRLFSPEEAALALHLTVIAEEPRVVALRAGIAVDEAVRLLAAMDRKGLVLSTIHRGITRYMASQFAVGFWEGQVNRLTPELVADFEEYLPSLFDGLRWREAPQMRIVPVNTSIEANTEVMPYEVVETLLREGRGRYAVSNCICRQEKLVTEGQTCGRPLETCLSFGGAADYVARTGRGRLVDRAEALDILRRADEAGLVLQASNSRTAAFICTCCGCCCSVLRGVKRHPRPAEIVATPFVAALRDDECSGCGVCETRCQMEALHLIEGRARLEETRCIGCGLCVSTCPGEALSLRRKPADEQPEVPGTIVDNYLQVGRARGRFGLAELAGLQLRSIVDRWRA